MITKAGLTSDLYLKLPNSIDIIDLLSNLMRTNTGDRVTDTMFSAEFIFNEAYDVISL